MATADDVEFERTLRRVEDLVKARLRSSRPLVATDPYLVVTGNDDGWVAQLVSHAGEGETRVEAVLRLESKLRAGEL